MNITNITKNIIYIYRLLENDSNQTNINKDIQKEEIKQLYIYLSILIFIIIAILGGYTIYRKKLEKNALKEIKMEYQLMIMNLINYNSLPVDKHPHSYNNINSYNLKNYENEYGNQSINSLEDSHEQRLENIRKKFGNSIVIKCLLKHYIEEIKYSKELTEEYGDNCTICMDNFVEFSIINKTPCEHIFHKKCFDSYLKEIQKEDKLLCPNCKQNLLINKKFIKLRKSSKQIEVHKEIISKKDIKVNDLNSENDIKNRNSIITNKNEEFLNNNNNEVIFIKRKGKNNDIKINSNKTNKVIKENNNIYEPIEIKIVKKKSIDSKNAEETILSRNNNNKIKKRNYDFINNNLKNKLNETRERLFNKRTKLNSNNINSERDEIVLSKNNCNPILSANKQEK